VYIGIQQPNRESLDAIAADVPGRVVSQSSFHASCFPLVLTFTDISAFLERALPIFARSRFGESTRRSVPAGTNRYTATRPPLPFGKTGEHEANDGEEKAKNCRKRGRFLGTIVKQFKDTLKRATPHFVLERKEEKLSALHEQQCALTTGLASAEVQHASMEAQLAAHKAGEEHAKKLPAELQKHIEDETSKSPAELLQRRASTEHSMEAQLAAHKAGEEHAKKLPAELQKHIEDETSKSPAELLQRRASTEHDLSAAKEKHLLIADCTQLREARELLWHLEAKTTEELAALTEVMQGELKAVAESIQGSLRILVDGMRDVGSKLDVLWQHCDVTAKPSSHQALWKTWEDISVSPSKSVDETEDADYG